MWCFLFFSLPTTRARVRPPFSSRLHLQLEKSHDTHVSNFLVLSQWSHTVLNSLTMRDNVNKVLPSREAHPRLGVHNFYWELVMWTWSPHVADLSYFISLTPEVKLIICGSYHKSHCYSGTPMVLSKQRHFYWAGYFKGLRFSPRSWVRARCGEFG